MNSVAVFCGSNFGNAGEYLSITKKLAGELVGRKVRVVYGGGAVGLMGALADEAQKIIYQPKWVK
jgi:predicted Rossmann-fold nucleotide-binding protein